MCLHQITCGAILTTATAEDRIGTLELFVSKNVSQEEDDNLLFCQICKLTFISLHNKRTHYSGKLHMDALLQCIKEAMANRSDRKVPPQPDAVQPARGRRGDHNSRRAKKLKGSRSDVPSGSSDSMDSQYEVVDNQQSEDDNYTGLSKSMNTLDSNEEDNQADCTDAHSDTGHQGASLDCEHPMEEEGGYLKAGGACEKHQRCCDGNDTCGQQSGDCHSIQGGHLGRCHPPHTPACPEDWHPAAEQNCAAITSDNHSPPPSSSTMGREAQPPVQRDAGRASERPTAVQRGVANEHPLQRGAVGVELYSTISKQMADFAITYSCKFLQW